MGQIISRVLFLANAVDGDFETARDRLATWTTGAALNALAAELLGPSLVTVGRKTAGDAFGTKRKPRGHDSCARGCFFE
jgi:hypothetical protein